MGFLQVMVFVYKARGENIKHIQFNVTVNAVNENEKCSNHKRYSLYNVGL